MIFNCVKIIVSDFIDNVTLVFHFFPLMFNLATIANGVNFLIIHVCFIYS